jgi:serine/threonine protein kinase
VNELPDDVVDHLRAALASNGASTERYEIVREIGRGGMGVVYLARDRELDREVALKVSAAALATPGDKERLRREARISAALEHPGIVPVYDIGVLHDGRPFHVMKHVSGARLDEIVRSSMSLRHRLEIFLKICEAVAYAHARGVIHRDLKPENVRVGGFGEVLVLDFGVAKRVRANSEESSRPNSTLAPGTAVGAVVGTPGWMAPEQARGDPDVDERADVHALGSILRSLASHADSGPKGLRAIAQKANALDREERYPSVEALAADTRRWIAGEPVEALPENLGQRVARLAVRHRVALILVGAYLAARVALLFLART